MAAYVVFLREQLTNEAEMEKYRLAARGARRGHQIKPIVFYEDIEVLEGPELDRIAILKFDDADRARAWYHDPKYQEAKKHRLKGADYRVILVESNEAER